MEDFRQRIEGKLPNEEEQEHINALTLSEIMDELIYAKGSFVYRAYLVKRMLQLRGD